MRISKILVLVALLTLPLVSVVSAQTYPTQDEYVTDSANVLSDQVEAQLEERAREIDNAGYAQIAIVTVQSIDPLTIEEYSIKLAEDWKPGDKELDNGMIFLLAIDQRKTRIEVGQGLEGQFNDAKVGRLLDDYAVPHFKNNDWEGGIVATSEALFGEFLGEPAPEQGAEESDEGSALLILLIIGAVVFIGVVVMITPNEDDDALFFSILGAIASAGGSGGKRGGGSFSGGGASR